MFATTSGIVSCPILLWLWLVVTLTHWCACAAVAEEYNTPRAPLMTALTNDGLELACSIRGIGTVMASTAMAIPHFCPKNML